MNTRKNRNQTNKEVNSKWHVREKAVRKARAAAKVNDLAYKLQTK